MEKEIKFEMILDDGCYGFKDPNADTKLLEKMAVVRARTKKEELIIPYAAMGLSKFIFMAAEAILKDYDSTTEDAYRYFRR